jgi:hypothetical protein
MMVPALARLSREAVAIMAFSAGPGRTVKLAAICGVFLLSSERFGLAAAPEPAVARGIAYLRSHAAGLQAGEMGLAVLAMLKADVPASDPTVTACVAKLRERFSSEGYQAQRSGGPDIYEAAVVAMALANLDAETRRGEIAALARYLTGKQKANGSWDYDNRTFGDTSISQYAVLGLWEASNAGADVSPGVFDRAAGWFISTQMADGGWFYHGDEPQAETLTMTAAGTSSLLICARQLAQYREQVRGDSPSKLLMPLTPSAGGGPRPGYEVVNGPSRTEPAIKRGLAWLGANFTTASGPVIGPSMYYALYGIERIGALADRETLGRIDWFEQGRRFILANHGPDGAWDSTYGPDPNTVWAILFLTRSTAKTLQRIEVKRLGAGTLLGGRGLPKDLSSLTVAGGRVVSRPMNGAVEGMLAVLEDPRAASADSALAGLVARYQAGGPGVLKPFKDRFRTLLADRDPGLRQVAAWALARTGDLDVVPDLINALLDDDAAVMHTARQGLQLLSRKLEGLGPPAGARPTERAEAAERWRAWYQRTRPLNLQGQDDDDHDPGRPR